MDYLCGAKRWVLDHKKGIIISGIVGTGLYFTTKSLLKSIPEQISSQIQEKMTQEEKAEFFNCISYKNAIATEFLKYMKSFHENIPPLPSLEEISAATSSREQKQIFWEDLKVKTFTRIFTLLYSQILFSLNMRLYLTIIARYIFLAKKSDDMFDVDKSIQLRFLQQSLYIISSGLIHLHNHVERSVGEVLSDWKITAPCTEEDLLEKIFPEIRSQIEQRVENHSILVEYLLPPEDTTSSPPDELKLLENEVRNIFETIDFSRCLESMLDEGFGYLSMEVKTIFETKRHENPESKGVIHMARLLPFLKNIEAALENFANPPLQNSLNNFDKPVYVCCV